jgi:hypothetical protein
MACLKGHCVSYVECSVFLGLKSSYHTWNTQYIEVKGRQFSMVIMPERNKHHCIHTVDSDSSPHEYQHVEYHCGILLSLVIMKCRGFVGYSLFFFFYFFWSYTYEFDTHTICYFLNVDHKTFITELQIKRVVDYLGSAAFKHHWRMWDGSVYSWPLSSRFKSSGMWYCRLVNN